MSSLVPSTDVQFNRLDLNTFIPSSDKKSREEDEGVSSSLTSTSRSSNQIEEFIHLSDQQKQILPKVNRLTKTIYAGAYPGSIDHHVTVKMQQELITGMKITHFVCLMEKEELKRFKSYQGLVAAAAQPEYIQFDIEDCHVATDEKVKELMDKLLPLAKDPSNRLYIHCWGGNGRTSTISTILLAKMHGFNWEKSLTHFFKSYLNRKQPICAELPQSKSQFNQIKRLCGGPEKSYEEWTTQCHSLLKKE
jgi:hypothetical protein